MTTTNSTATDELIHDRDEAILRIRKALKARTGRAWSVKGGRGTSWGWITVTAPPARCGEYGRVSDEDALMLAAAFGLTDRDGFPTRVSSVSIAASTAYRTEYVQRAEGREVTVVGRPYWD